MSVRIIELSDSASDTLKFIKAQWLFYKNDPYFVPPLLMDRKKILNKKKNPFFKHSDMQLFLAENDGKIVGRIAAITNDNHNITHNDKVGFFGFFECIDNQEVANALFDSAKKWLISKNMNVMRGPVNPSLNDECGLLVDGFNDSPLILMTYNPQYYMKLIDNYGFFKAMDLYAYILYNEKYMSEKMQRLQGIVRERYGITIRNFELKDKEGFKRDVETLKTIYNAAWEKNWGFVKFTDEEIDFMAEDLKQVADPTLAFIVEVKGKVAGFGLTIPNINECLIYNKKGRLIPGIWHLLTKKKKMTIARIIALGILPEFRNIGLDAVMYYETGKRAADIGIYKGEASWILENNEMMNRALTVTMLNKVYKTYRLYDIGL
jgi:hypothetical protein